MISPEDRGYTLTYLGKDRRGFAYYRCSDGYIYNRYPNKEYWKNGHDYNSEWCGWVCSCPVWERTFHIVLV